MNLSLKNKTDKVISFKGMAIPPGETVEFLKVDLFEEIGLRSLISEGKLEIVVEPTREIPTRQKLKD